MIIKNTTAEDYQILRYHVTQLIKQLAIIDTDKYSPDDISDALDIADTVAEAFDALDRKLKDGDTLPNEWTKNR